ncbi:Hypothetical predicted protein [Lecanosticta acicola]|uniref:Heterokaryon incompatibility domain-containing protein n=1 Tax=Lecanosticta acicola TaxID=111012 RepID=A0AAI8Z1I5_9PEZI|nr:Hypothetical predicted protein [Lecanosticta acicola]
MDSLRNFLERFRKNHTETIYRPLKSRAKQIRVLEVYAGQYSDPLRCKTHHRRLGEPETKYETISYCWGDATQRHTIELDGHAFDVPMSSYMALKRMRLEDSNRMLWIDAVCINQANRDERQQQVAIMNKVYGQSQGNLIYLGESDSAPEALECIHNVLEEAARETNNFEDLRSSVLEENGQCRYEFSSHTPPQHENAWNRFWSVPWFRRLWVRQEAILAPRNCCFYGELSISLLDVCRAAVWFNCRNGSSIPVEVWNALIGMMRMWVEFIDPIDLMAEIHVSRERPRDMYVGDALSFARDLESEEPRDHVYGVLGMMSCTWNGVPADLRPDYAKPIEAVLRDATRYALQEARHVDRIFAEVWHRTTQELEDSSWRSWLPHWDLGFDAEAEPLYLPRSEAPEPPRSEAEVQSTRRGNIRVLGCCLDQVALRTSGWINPQWFVELKGYQYILDWLRDVHNVAVATKGARYVPTPGLVLDGALLCTQPSEDEGEQGESDSRFDQFCNFLAHNRRLPHRPRSEQPDTDDDDEDTLAYMYQDSMYKYCRNRRFFSTARGWVGVGARITEKGDQIVAFNASRQLFVLRQYGEQYRLVGECYIHGVTPRQACEMSESRGQGPKWYELI